MTSVRAWFAERTRAAVGGLRGAFAVVCTVLAPVGRRGAGIVVGIGVVLSVLAVLVLVGAARNDASISADQGVAVGEVLEGSDATHTFVRYTASDGAVLTPDSGVLYPRGLEPGNYVLVEYDRSKPELVRVAGRSWTTGLAPVAVGIAGLWVVLGPTAWLLARRRRTIAAGAREVPDDRSPEDRTPDDRSPDGRSPDREPVGASR